MGCKMQCLSLFVRKEKFYHSYYYQIAAYFKNKMKKIINYSSMQAGTEHECTTHDYD